MQTGLCTKGIGKMINKTEKERRSGLMAHHTKANIKMVTNTEKEFLHGQTPLPIPVSLKTT